MQISVALELYVELAKQCHEDYRMREVLLETVSGIGLFLLDKLTRTWVEDHQYVFDLWCATTERVTDLIVPGETCKRLDKLNLSMLVVREQFQEGATGRTWETRLHRAAATVFGAGQKDLIEYNGGR